PPLRPPLPYTTLFRSDREVADQADAAGGGVAAQLAPLALEPDLVGGGSFTCEPLPVADPVRVTPPELGELGVGDLGVGIGQEAADRKSTRLNSSHVAI